MRPLDLWQEKKLWKKGFKKVACLDEAGRGPLAGPVVAAAVMIKKFPISLNSERITRSGTTGSYFQFLNIKDSKKLTKNKREELYKILTNHPKIKWGIGRVSEKMIDKINIKNAAELAMEKALLNLEKKIQKRAGFLIIDGNHLNNSKLKTRNHKLIVKADEKVFSCQAASIIAKVWRDKIMQGFHKKYPRYGFVQHKGYPTKYHLKMLKKYGSCKIHRRSFKPVAKMQNVK